MRHYYAAKNRLGLSYAYDCDYWRAYRFNSVAERDAWVKTNEYDGRQYVAEAVPHKVALKIAGYHKTSPRVRWYYDIIQEPDGEIIAVLR